MSDIIIAPADVELNSSVQGLFVQFGEAVSAGQCVYFDTATVKYFLADCDSASKSAVAGIVISAGAAADGYGYIVGSSGAALAIGGTTSAGEVYVLSGTPGGIMPSTDLVSGQLVSVVGVGDTGNNLVVGIFNSGVDHV
jgi:hypothetical protein